MTLLAAYLGSLVPALGWTLAHFLWQGALVALVLEVLLKTCRTAQARHNLALGALILMAALPIMTFCWLQGDVRVVFAPVGFPGLAENRAVTWEKLAVGAWLIGVVALAVRMAGGLWLVERWRRGSTPLPPVWASRCALLQQRMAGSLKVVFAQSQAAAAPLVAGWLKPMVLIPTAALSHMPVDQLEALILHELAHVRRFDAFANLIQAVVETVLFYHPAVWWVSRRIRVEREHCCDDLAVAVVQDPALYVRALQSLEALRSAPAGALASNGGDLKARAARILGLALAPERPALSRMAAVLILTLAAAAMTHSAAVKAEPAPTARLTKAMAATPSPSRVSGIPRESDPSLAYKAVVLVRKDPILGPKIAVAAPDPAPLALATNLAAPDVDHASPQAARPVELASVAPAAPPAPTRPIAEAAAPADPREGASSFVRSYAAATARREVIARWVNPICVLVTGLADDQAIAVRLRIEDVARQLGLRVQPARCKRSDIQVGFTTDPQAVLDEVIKTNGRLLGDKTSGTEQVKTVSLPIQAWYQTNGKEYAANDTGGLKALADYRANDRRDGWAGLKINVQNQQGGDPASMSSMAGIGCEGPCGGAYTPDFSNGPFGGWPGGPRQFQNVFVIVDLKRTGAMSLSLISDYVTMLVFSQPKSLGSCQALPSITDLFTTCPGRAAPDGLTRADVTYLHALYAADPPTGGTLLGHQAETLVRDQPALVADVVDVMAPLLVSAKIVVR